MPVDHIRYDVLTQDALRSVIRTVLSDVASKGLPGDHHFFVTFDTRADGVRLSARLKAQYPEEMTIVLQHQFWELKVGADDFDVGLAFGGIPERLHVPFHAVKAFVDPSVQFALQFTVDIDETAQATDRQTPARPTAVLPSATGSRGSSRTDAESETTEPVPDGSAEPAREEGAEIVPLDRFRKK
ncbi:MAG: hypothetical protein J2P53_02795 [Bradyrhizobiaceae bacterium]|nr:hypothetical protein [Bradyrhizobiaceae bacterium]